MTRKRFLISLILAILFHLVVLLVLQAVVKGQADRIPEYSGPLYVSLDEVPVMQARPDELQTRPEPERIDPQRAERQPEPEPTPAQRDPNPVETVAPSRAPTEQPRITKAPEQIEEPQTRPESPSRENEQPLPVEESAPFVQPAAERPQRPPEVEEQPEEPLLALDNLDRTLTNRPVVPASDNETAENTDTSSTSQAGLAAEGLNIQWEDPAEGREPTSQPKPDIPSWVGREGAQLRVEVSFLLTPQGYLSNLEVTRSSGYPDVDAAVLDALRRWTFKPVQSTTTVRGRIPYLIRPE